MTQQQALKLSFGMAEMAAKYPNVEIANALSRVAQKLESYGAPFAPSLSSLDRQIIMFYHSRNA